MVPPTDDDRKAAAKIAAYAWRWRPGFVPSCHYMHHRCESRLCEVKEIQYAATLRDGELNVSLTRPPEDDPCSIERLTPLYGCLRTGAVHSCGDSCDLAESHDFSCPISGIRVGEATRDEMWSPYRREGRNDWKLAVFLRRSNAIEPLNVRARIESASSSFGVDAVPDFGADMVRRARARTHLRCKSAAFDLAFAIASNVLCDARFCDAIRRQREQRAKMNDAAQRAVTRMEHQRIVVTAGNLMQALPADVESIPILVQSRAQLRDHAMRYADRCVAFWHLLWHASDAAERKLRETSFRDFCAATLSLFGHGHNMPDWIRGHDRWIVGRDPLLYAFPLNRWAKRNIYSELDDTKISGVMRRVESNIKELVNNHVNESDSTGAYLRYADLSYDEVPEDAFLEIRR